jgi:hypothetical protein
MNLNQFFPWLYDNGGSFTLCALTVALFVILYFAVQSLPVREEYRMIGFLLVLGAGFLLWLQSSVVQFRYGNWATAHEIKLTGMGLGAFLVELLYLAVTPVLLIACAVWFLWLERRGFSLRKYWDKYQNRGQIISIRAGATAHHPEQLERAPSKQSKKRKKRRNR